MIKHTEENQVHRSRVSCLGHVVYIYSVLSVLLMRQAIVKPGPFLYNDTMGYSLLTIYIQ